MTETLLELLTAFLLLAGSFFLLMGSYGLAKLPSLMQRLHAPTKATTLGVGGILLASMTHAAATLGRLSLHELLIALFLFLSAPVSAHMLAKAHILRNRAEAGRLPPTGRPTGWATLDAGAGTSEAD
ncbi:Na+/H+ antiporter subunit G [Benzoatithermus flavus]|uniref:Na+/H+ antiporter subunit G n=1 Tax=Benzoatithermus flavus TaxID=3108223 RepID=A0ABU8XMM7_9PROT